MDKRDLLETLRNEAMLMNARARGAEQAYRFESMRQAAEECGVREGDMATITFADGVVRAEVGSMFWSEWDFRNYVGPAFYARRVLKNGKISNHSQPTFTIEAWRAGIVALEHRPKD